MKLLFLIVCFCALIGAGGSGYLLWEKFNKDGDISTVVEEIKRELESTRQQTILASQSELEKTARELQDVRKEIDSAVDRIRTDVAKLVEFEIRLDRMRDNMDSQADLNRSVGNQLQDLRSSINILSNGLERLEENFAGMSERVATQLPIKNQGNINLVGKHRFEALPNERRIILSNFRELPINLEQGDGTVDFYNIWNGSEASINDVQDVFLDIIGKGYDAHLIVGRPSPIERLVWIEVHTDEDFAIIHPSLDYELWNKIDNRAKVPSLFKSGDFGITYIDGRVEVYQLTN